MSIQSQIGLFGRDFLTGLLTTVKGKDFKLDDNCLSAEFDQNCENLADAIKTGNVFKLMSAASAIKEELEQRCPSSDLTKIFKDTTALGVTEVMHRMITHRQEMSDLFKEEIFGRKMTALNIGQFFGKLVNVIVYQISHNLIFLGEVQYFSEESVELFVNGFFEGVSSVAFDQNKCYKDITVVKGDIVKVVEDLVNALKNKSAIIDAFTKLVEVIMKLKDTSSNCNFVKLGTSLASLATKIGIVKFGYKVVSHLTDVVQDVRGVYNGVETKDFKQAGIEFGFLVKLTLDYSTM
jgi:hypothetical protein